MLPQEHTWKRQEPLCENRFRIGATLRSFGPTCALLREIGVQTPFRSEQQQALLLNRCSRRDRSTIRRSIDQSQRSQAAATAAVRLAARCACRIASCTNTHDTAAVGRGTGTGVRWLASLNVYETEAERRSSRSGSRFREIFPNLSNIYPE